MTNFWNWVKNTFSRVKGLTQVGTANTIVTGISALFWFYIAALVGEEGYGEVSYFLAIAGVSSTISLLGSSYTMTIYTSKGIQIANPLHFVTMISSIVSSVVDFVIFYNIGVSLYVLSLATFTLFAAELIGKKLYKEYSQYKIIQRLMVVGFAISLYHLIGLDGILIGYGLSYCPFLIRVAQKFKESKLDLSILRPRMGFMTNSYVLSLSRIFVGYADRLIVYPLFGFALLGNYQLGIQVLMVLTIIPNSVFTYILPHDARGDPKSKLKKMTILLSVIFAGLGILLAPSIIPIIFPDYDESVEVIQILSLASIPMTINLMYMSKFIGAEKIRIVLIASSFFLVSQITGILVLGPIFDINGVAIATVLANSIQSVFFATVHRFTKERV